MVQQEEIPKNPSSAEELLATPMPVDDQPLNSVVNVPVPPVVIPIQTPQLQILQPIIPTPPIPRPTVPPIAPIPAISPVTRPLAPVCPPIHPLRPKKHEENDSDLDAGHDDSGPKRAASAMEFEISEESKQAQKRHEKAMQEL
ncbi:hypothetical protein FRX31_019763 [Thalictrum thalictroides]|uniref:Uncharacterized protein n=1 Tax=Thalictrum thalictroides TaxID=46969 RepID=A0A7J6W125_THATH|nr:hypothetical protein FRX31_019763 [Thalictrum thalictroides]